MITGIIIFVTSILEYMRTSDALCLVAAAISTVAMSYAMNSNKTKQKRGKQKWL